VQFPRIWYFLKKISSIAKAFPEIPCVSANPKGYPEMPDFLNSP